MGNTNLLRCMHTNVDCLTNKLDELKSRLTSLQPDTVTITEVFPKHFLNAIPQESLGMICTIVTLLQVEGCVCIVSHH